MKYFWNINLRENRISYVQTYIFIFSCSCFNIICMNIFKNFDWRCIPVKSSSLLSFLYMTIFFVTCRPYAVYKFSINAGKVQTSPLCSPLLHCSADCKLFGLNSAGLTQLSCSARRQQPFGWPTCQLVVSIAVCRSLTQSGSKMESTARSHNPRRNQQAGCSLATTGYNTSSPDQP